MEQGHGLSTTPGQGAAWLPGPIAAERQELELLVSATGVEPASCTSLRCCGADLEGHCHHQVFALETPLVKGTRIISCLNSAKAPSKIPPLSRTKCKTCIKSTPLVFYGPFLTREAVLDSRRVGDISPAFSSQSHPSSIFCLSYTANMRRLEFITQVS